MATERVVAFGFLTNRDLELLGVGFTRHFPVTNDDLFAELIDKLDQVEIAPADRGIILRTRDRG
ncbi:MAG TPA: hypothetical protein VN137_10285 [Sphingomonas sp.]|nr:hypothetical protein [Sphingomonas sp.]